MRVCRDCGTANHEYHLYCRKCSSSLFCRAGERSAPAPLIYERLLPRARRA